VAPKAVTPRALTRSRDLGLALLDIGLTAWTSPLYRIQDGDGLDYRRYPTPRHRFDAPADEYAVLYANDTRVATFNETYAERRRRMVDADAGRHLVEISAERELSVVDLRDDRTLSGLDLDARVSVGDDYQACRELALALHERWTNADGIAYAARWGGVRTSVVAPPVAARRSTRGPSKANRAQWRAAVYLSASRPT